MTPAFRRLLGIALFTAFAVAWCAPPSGSIAHGEDVEGAAKAAVFNQEFPRLVEQYCARCHRGSKPKGDVRFDRPIVFEQMETERTFWESVLEMIESSAMPPEDQPQPSPQERRRMVALLESSLYVIDCNLPHDPGRVTIRRLNRAEYDNTLRDLLGIDARLSQDFPSDDVGNGFDNMGDVLSLPPLLLEKYMDAAEKAAALAIQDPRSLRLKATRAGDELRPRGGVRRTSEDVYVMFSEGGVIGSFDLPRRGRYRIVVSAGADQAGPEVAKMELIAGEQRKMIEVPAKAPAMDDYAWEVELDAGAQRIEARFANDFYNPKDPDPSQRDRNLHVRSITVSGPANLPAESFSAAHRALVTHTPNDLADRRQVRFAAAQVLHPLLMRAFRRPVTREEVRPYVELVELAVAQGESYERGLQVALSAILVSPHFLFRVESDTDPDDPTKKRSLNDFELATRLSYFLWSSMPDDELFRLALRGALSDDATLDEQVRRMLRDPKSRALADNFAAQWLNLRNLREVTPDPQKFPEFDDALREDMQLESLELFLAVMREDRPVTELLTADYTFINARLARLYGLPTDGLSDDRFQRVALDTNRRRGLLTQAGILTLTSNPGRTSPVKRGKWIMENILGTPPPDPPANVPLLEETQKNSPNLSLRQQLEIHRANPVCASCHRQMDALGFGFENFDAIGRWRDQEGGRPIDASGILPDGSKFNGPKELIAILSSQREAFAEFLAGKMLTFALGRGLEKYDECAVREIAGRLKKEDYRFSALVLGIVHSEPFRMRRGEKRRDSSNDPAP